MFLRAPLGCTGSVTLKQSAGVGAPGLAHAACRPRRRAGGIHSQLCAGRMALACHVKAQAGQTEVGMPADQGGSGGSQASELAPAAEQLSAKQMGQRWQQQQQQQQSQGEAQGRQQQEAQQCQQQQEAQQETGQHLKLGGRVVLLSDVRVGMEPCTAARPCRLCRLSQWRRLQVRAGGGQEAERTNALCGSGCAEHGMCAQALNTR
jgi:hypothetical protein